MNEFKDLFRSIKKFFSKGRTAGERVQGIIVSLVWLFFFAYSLTLVFLYAWVLMSSFKDTIDFGMTPFELPKFPTMDNYEKAFYNLSILRFVNGQQQRFYIETLLLNTGIYILISSVVATFTPCLLAYLASRFDFKMNAFLDITVVISMVLPIVNSRPSEITMMRTLGLMDTYVGMAFLRMTHLGTTYLFFKAVFKGLSNAYAEAAELDGANYFTVMTRIEIPMISNILLILFILQVMGFWADWQLPMIFFPSTPTVAYALYELQFTHEPDLVFEGVKFAACILSSIPTLLVFVIFRKKMMGGLSFGGLK